MPNNKWTDEDKKIVRDLWMDGYSSRYIGDKMGTTRRAIVGLLNRMGLLRVERPANPSPYQQAIRNQYTGRLPPKPLKAILGQKRSDGEPVTVKDIPMPTPSEAAKTGYRKDGKLLGLIDLQWNSCRWPVGDPTTPNFGYCGAQTASAVCPYCVIHKKIAFYNPRLTGGRFVLKAQVGPHGK